MTIVWLIAVILQSQTPSCATIDVDLPEALAAWRTPAAAESPLQPGQAVSLPLRPIAEVATVTAPRIVEGGPTTGALVPLEISTAGTYGVALDLPAWIEIVRDDRVIPSIAHGHGPACSSIRKIVDFPLVPGRYMIQLSGTRATAARILVIRR